MPSATLFRWSHVVVFLATGLGSRWSQPSRHSYQAVSLADPEASVENPADVKLSTPLAPEPSSWILLSVLVGAVGIAVLVRNVARAVDK